MRYILFVAILSWLYLAIPSQDNTYLETLESSNNIYVAPPVARVWSEDMGVYRIVGDSMQPMFANGSVLLTTTRFELEDIEVGHIVIAKYGDKLIAHQVIKVNQDPDDWWAIMQGTNSGTTQRVDSKNIRAIAIGVFW